MENLDKELKKGHTYRQWIFSLLANWALFGYGMECGWISPTTKILQSKESPSGEPVSHYTISWIASSMSIAAIFGVSLYTFITDRYGRKIAVIFIAIPQAISWIIRLSYSSTTGLIIARIVSGVSIGGCYNVIPIYVKEISQDDIRGVLGTLLVILHTMGLLVMYIIGTYLDYYTVIFIALAPPIFLSIVFWKAPESPAFLVKQKKYDLATQTVAYLRGLAENDEIVIKTVDCMKNEEEYFKSLPKITYASILREKSWRRGFILIATIFVFHAFNGAYAIITYASAILISTGAKFEIIREKSWRRGFILIATIFVFHAFNGAYAIITYASAILISTGAKFEISPEIQTFSFPIFMIVGSLSLAACVEKFGRKPLLIAAFLVSGSSMTIIAVLMVLQHQGWSIPSWLPVLAIILAVTVYGGGVSPLPYIIITEMFNFQVRGKVIGVVVTGTWMLTAIVVIIYTPLTTCIGPYSPFVLYAVINFLGSIFTLLYIPETRAKTEEEIEVILAKESRIKNDLI